ncbi:hypothetical protein ACFFX1_03305 [Dactylosporangium sucinum]|uniref:hypothetical protein n=1 Tax=Dactylosporangium sucinum TaxID=1424081 RepID=UPI00167EBC10|nr:hypothetical protein [Dactylosporangium sucinum]
MSLAIYQPFMQPSGFWADPQTGASFPELAGNNTYWPRDVRQLAILLALAGVILIVDGRIRGVVTGAVATGAWLIADLWLDRVDISGQAAAAWLGVGGGLGFFATALVGARLSTGRGAGRGPVASAAAKDLAAGTAAVLAVTSTLITTPWDEPVTRPDLVRVEDALLAIKSGLVVMFAVVAVSLVARRLTTARAWLVAAFVVVAALAAWPGSGAASYGSLLVAPIAVSLAVAAARDVPLGRLVAVAGACSVTLPLSLLILYFGGTAAGGAMTSLAGNPPVNGADTDLSIALAGLALGLLLALAGYGATRPARGDAGASGRERARPDAAAGQPAAEEKTG